MSHSSNSIQTFTGQFFDPFKPDPAKIKIEDIAHALANQSRFSGHTRVRWSVAAHSCLVSALCADPHKFAGLMHDAHEAYVVDMPTPLKRHESMAAYRILELGVAYSVRSTFGLQLYLDSIVEHADRVALFAEADELMHGTKDWPAQDGPRPKEAIDVARIMIRDMLDLDSERLFLSQFTILTGGDVHA